jgi:hypothetical protein
MPKVGYYDTKVQPFIPGNSPGPISAPHFADSGQKELTEGALQDAAQSASNVVNTENLVGKTWSNIAGDAVGVGMAYTQAQRRKNNAAQAASVLSSNSTASSYINKAKMAGQNYSSQQLQNPLTADFSDKGYNDFTGSIDKTIADNRAALQQQLQGESGAPHGLATYDEAMNVFRTSQNEKWNTTKESSRDLIAKNQYSDSVNDMTRAASSGDLGTLKQELSNFNNRATATMAATSGVPSSKFHEDYTNIVKANIAGAQSKFQNADAYVDAADGDYLKGNQQRLADAQTYQKALTAQNPIFASLDGETLKGAISAQESIVDKAKSAVREGFSNNAAKIEAAASTVGLNLQSSDPNVRQQAQQKMVQLHSQVTQLTAQMPQEDKHIGYEATKVLNGYINHSINVNVTMAGAEQARNASNISASNENINMQQAALKQSDAAAQAYASLGANIKTMTDKLTAAKAVHNDSIKYNGYQKESGVTADDVRATRGALEKAWQSGQLTREQYAGYSDTLTHIADTALPINKKNPNPDAFPDLLYSWNKAKPVDADWASLFVHDINSPGGKASLAAINKRLPTLMDEIKNAPENRGLNFSADKLRKMAEAKIMRKWISVPHLPYAPPQKQAMPMKANPYRLVPPPPAVLMEPTQ